MSETITASLTVSGGDVITVNLNTAARGPAGTGGGGTTFVALTDAASADLPTINGPLSSALSGKAPSSGISPSAISGTAVIDTDPRLSDARTPTAHTHVVSAITPVSGQHLIGRHAGGNGAAQEVTVGNGLEFQGSGIRRSALTGDVTASAGSNSTTIANDAISNAKLANMAQATIKGRAAGGGTGDPQDLTASEARTALGSGATGDELFTAASASAARGTLGVRTFIKSADESRNTTTTFAVDSELKDIPLEAGKSYKIEFLLTAYLPTTEGAKARLIIPLGTITAPNALGFHATPAWGNGGLSVVSVVTSGSTRQLFLADSVGYNANRANNGIVWTGTLAASGNLSLEWAQRVSGGNNTTMLAGSLITVTEL